MAQLQRMDACFDTLSIELYQVNIRVDRITRRQAAMDDFALEASPPPPPVTSDFEDEDDDDGNASSTDETFT